MTCSFIALLQGLAWVILASYLRSTTLQDSSETGTEVLENGMCCAAKRCGQSLRFSLTVIRSKRTFQWNRFLQGGSMDIESG